MATTPFEPGSDPAITGDDPGDIPDPLAPGELEDDEDDEDLGGVG